MTASEKSLTSGKGLSALLRSSDAFLALAVMVIIGLMIVPLPPFTLDLLIALNLALSVGILLIAMYIQEPLDFSVFPSLLLLVTLFRLGLNISASRLILLQADAGKVITTFGNFVVGGNYVVGVVVFLTLMIIQFVVITNGAGRVAEVAARFTLDAMPGKQLSIDADLNAGIITEAEARQRRRLIEAEADFYGAMDGASKFVKGDAVAGVAIVLVNILGGFIIGMWQLKMSLLEALQTYTLLTVGAGLVIQIPALLVSTASGLIVTRTASESSLGGDVVHQFANPRALAVAAGMILLLALVPGLPKLPFLLVGALIGGVTWAVRRRQAQPPPPPAAPTTAELEGPQAVAGLLQVDPLELEIGYGLIPLAGEDQAENLLRRVSAIRRQIALELGIILPKVRIRDNLHLPPNTYRIKLRGEEVARGELMLDRYLAIAATEIEEELPGIPTREPAFGLPARWISEGQRARAELLGYTVVDPLSVVATHLTEVIRNYAPYLLGRQEVRDLLNAIKEQAPAVVEDVVPDLLSLGEVQDVLHNLLRERVSIRDLPTILEALANQARLTRDTDGLSEAARQALARSLTNQYKAEDGRLHVFTLSPALETRLKAALTPTERGMGFQIDPGLAQELLLKISQEMEKMAQQGYQPVLLCSREIRLALRRLTERALPNLAILAFSEVWPRVEVQAHGMVEIGGAAADLIDGGGKA
jgi:flagellar biosynthesis protein FlhA